MVHHLLGLTSTIILLALILGSPAIATHARVIPHHHRPQHKSSNDPHLLRGIIISSTDQLDHFDANQAQELSARSNNAGNSGGDPKHDSEGSEHIEMVTSTIPAQVKAATYDHILQMVPSHLQDATGNKEIRRVASLGRRSLLDRPTGSEHPSQMRAGAAGQLHRISISGLRSPKDHIIFAMLPRKRVPPSGPSKNHNEEITEKNLLQITEVADGH